MREVPLIYSDGTETITHLMVSYYPTRIVRPAKGCGPEKVRWFQRESAPNGGYRYREMAE